MPSDLHFHSTDSDGKSTNRERVEEIEKIDPEHLGIWAVTNHDRFSPEFVGHAREKGIQALWGVEISAHSKELAHSFHITCYTPRISEKIQWLTNEILRGKTEKVISQIVKLRRHGLDIEESTFFTWVHAQGFRTDGVSNAHITEYLWEKATTKTVLADITKGEVRNKYHFLHECLKWGGKFSHIGTASTWPYEPEIGELARIAADEGAILSLAHPHFSFRKLLKRKQPWLDEASMREYAERYLFPFCIDMGIRNFEVNSEAHPAWVDTIVKTVGRTGGILTFGSDNHDPNRHDRDHGLLGAKNEALPESLLEPTIQRLREMIV